jgi:outer membrane lipoprotein
MSFLYKKTRVYKKSASILCFVLFAVMAGCAHPISEDLRKSIDPNASLQIIKQNPNQFTDKNVMFGGVIVATRNFPDKTEIEVIQKSLDSIGYPSRGDETEGRFVFVQQGFLEPEIYSKGRYVTGAGKLAGTQRGKIDNREIQFPVIEVVELRLWEDYSEAPYGNYSYPYYYGPYGGLFFPYGRGFR